MQPETWLHEAGIASIAHHHGAVNIFSIQVHTARQASEVDGGGNLRDLFYFFLFFNFLFLVVYLIYVVNYFLL